MTSTQSSHDQIFRSQATLWLTVLAMAALLTIGAGAFGQEEVDDEAEVEMAAIEDPHAAVFLEENYPSASQCIACHERIYWEWASSNHAYSSISPMFHKFEQTINDLSSGTIGSFCVRCHQQVGTQMGEPREAPLWERSQISREGVTCITCHRVAGAYGKVDGERTITAGEIYEPMRGSGEGSNIAEVLEDPDYWKVDIDGESRGSAIHQGVIEFEQITESEFCVSCHQVAVDPGIKLEVVWDQYRDSPAAAAGVQCQDCHMGEIPGIAAGYDMDYAAIVDGEPVGEPRPHHNHAFYGPGYPIAHPGIFPHNPDAESWTIEEWLNFDYRSNWGTDDYEEVAFAYEDTFEFTAPDVVDLVYEAADTGDTMPEDDLYDLLDYAEEAVDGRIEQLEDPSGLEQAFAAFELTVEDLIAGAGDAEVLAERLDDAVDTLQLAFSYEWPDTWAYSDDRIEAREVIDWNLMLLDQKRDLRVQVMENGSRIDGPYFDSPPAVGQSFSFSYRVTNTDEGHNLPSGSLGAQPEIWLNVALIDPDGVTVFESGYVDGNGDMADLHSLEVAAGEIAHDDQLFNLQTKFLTTNVKGTDREMYLPVNFDIDQIPFLRPANVPTTVLNHPPFIRMEGRSIPPLGWRDADYTVPAEAMSKPGEYTLAVRLRSRAEPIYFMRFVGATTEMEQAMNEWMIDVHPYAVTLEVTE
tara:strand:+ start:8986 stop:11067 length:2082 start_codon:yes stop_codon:yes gene_type:complete